MKELARMCEQLRDQQDRVKKMEGELKDEKAKLRAMETEDLPMMMIEAGLSELKLEDGRRVVLKEEVDARLTEANREAGVKWLVENGFGGLVKTEVLLRFPRGSHDQAVDVCDRLAADHDEVELKEAVHPATLKAFVKEQLTSGHSVPMDIFSVYPYNKVEVK